MANGESRFPSVGVLDYVGSMLVFVAIIGVLVALDVRDDQGILLQAFGYNYALNGLIVFVLGLGILYNINQVFVIGRAGRWIRQTWYFGRRDGPGLMVTEPGRGPRLLSSVANVFRDRSGPIVFSAYEYRAILDSVGTRLDESREISRYMTGLLIFLGLLGTFWGLLQTVSAVSTTIEALSQVNGSGTDQFNDFLTQLKEPLSGMGIAFSSSLLGLSGSLVLGFLDLRAGQAQNRFFNNFEEYLSQAADIGAPKYAAPRV